MKNPITPLREKIKKQWISQTETPLIIYLAVAVAIFVAWSIRNYHPDLSLNLISELIGAAFIIFVVNILLVRSKNKRWKTVNEQIDYLISRNINRLRDGVAFRAFNFRVKVSKTDQSTRANQKMREQREDLFVELTSLNSVELAGRVKKDLFSDLNYQYFNEKAADIWDILNMKYSEYLSPKLITLLMDLHIQLKDLCGHIRVYQRSEQSPDEAEFYRKSGLEGGVHNLSEIIDLINQLKKEGYSEPPRIDPESRLF
ncbi:MAG: hypothetical protein EA362_11320 [Saprospirales bacterium]|nr:MAG: hypothetical protein EA362_11320 [Saprospirales bacterium]